MNDTKILSAIRALHERFIEEPTEQKAFHFRDFIYGRSGIRGSFYDLTPPALSKVERYYNAVAASFNDNFSPVSLAHLQTVADKIFGETA